MKYFLLVLISFLSIEAFAQLNNEITLDDLKSPTFPASVIIDSEAKSISRPTDRNAVTTSLLSAFNEDGLAPNVAMEISPFWLKSRPNLSFEEYINPDGLLNSIKQTLGISIATDEMDNNPDGRKLGFGIRAQLIPGEPSQKAKDIIAGIQYDNLVINLITASSLSTITTPEDLYANVRNLVAQVISGTVNLGPISGLTSQQVSEFLKQDALPTIRKIIDKNQRITGETMSDYVTRLIDIIDNSSITNTITLQNELKNRVGLIVEGALATGINFPTNEFDNEKFDQLGLWGTITYRPDDQYGDATLLIRYMKSYRDSIATNFDVGLRIDRTTKDFVLGFEGLFRSSEIEFADVNLNNEPITRVETSDSFRFTFNLDYKLSDALFLTSTIGKDFDSPITGSGQLLTIFGVNFSIPANKKVSL